MKITILFFAMIFMFSVSSCYRAQPYPVQITVWDDGEISSTVSGLELWIESGSDTIYLNQYDWGYYTGTAWDNMITIHVGNDSLFNPKHVYAKNDSIVEAITIHLNGVN